MPIFVVNRHQLATLFIEAETEGEAEQLAIDSRLFEFYNEEYETELAEDYEYDPDEVIRIEIEEIKNMALARVQELREKANMEPPTRIVEE